MINKKGFVSMSIVYAFFIIFLSLLILMMSTYVNNRVTYTVYKNDIKEQLSQNIGVPLQTYYEGTTGLRNTTKTYYTGSNIISRIDASGNPQTSKISSSTKIERKP